MFPHPDEAIGAFSAMLHEGQFLFALLLSKKTAFIGAYQNHRIARDALID